MFILLSEILYPSPVTYPHVFSCIAVLETARPELTPNSELVVRNFSLKVDIRQERVEVRGVDGCLLHHDRELQGTELRCGRAGYWLCMLLYERIQGKYIVE